MRTVTTEIEIVLWNVNKMIKPGKKESMVSSHWIFN